MLLKRFSAKPHPYAPLEHLFGSTSLQRHKSHPSNSNHPEPYIVTKSGLQPDLSQQQIDDAVKSQTSNNDNLETLSLYPILPTPFLQSSPTVVLTQSLFHVCARSTRDVQSIISTCQLHPSNMDVHSFQPQSLTTIHQILQSSIDMLQSYSAPEPTWSACHLLSSALTNDFTWDDNGFAVLAHLLEGDSDTAMYIGGKQYVIQVYLISNARIVVKKS